MIKKIFSKYYYKYFHYSAFFYYLRHYLHESEIAGLKPFNKKAVISDTFVYRNSVEWQTSFQLFNISSLIFPERFVKEICEIHFFGKKGNFIKKTSYTLEPLELQTINISNIDGLEAFGTFAVFHHSDVVKEIRKKGSCLTERGYVAYRYKNSPLYSYCHGNLQALSKSLSSKIKSVAAVSCKDHAYSPQIIFSDCDLFELIFTNPTNKTKKINIELYNKKNQIIDNYIEKIEPFGVKILTFPNNDRKKHTIKTYGQIMMWRPIIKKFYATHFDVLHG